jgi:hypothetical protein
VQVRGIYRDLSKVPAAFSAKTNFSAVEGNASDEGTLDLMGSDRTCGENIFEYQKCNRASWQC